MINETELRNNFCRNLNTLLEANDKKQIDIANALGVSTSIINDWCKGKKIPRLDKIHKIADYFGVEPNDLLSSRKVPDYDPNFLTIMSLYAKLDDKDKQIVLSLLKSLAKEE